MAQREAARIRDTITDQLAVPRPGCLRAMVHTVLYAFDGRQAVRTAVFNARQKGAHASPVLAYNRAFMDEVGRRIGARIKISEEAAFIVSRLVVSISRQLLFEGRTLRLDNLEDELVCILESYLAALEARGGRPTANG